MEFSVWMVSTRLSPFTVELLDPPADSVSQDRRFSASSKLPFVRVDGSKNRFTTVRPRKAGTFLTRRSFTPSNMTAVCRICIRSSAVRSVVRSRCFCDNISNRLLGRHRDARQREREIRSSR